MINLCSCYFKQLNVINVNFFTPCLLFSKVAFSLSSGILTFTRSACNLPFLDKLQELWIIPVFFILISGASLVVGWLLGFLFGLNPRQRHACTSFSFVKVTNISSRNFVMAASMIMNSNSLPVALLQALAESVPGLGWGQDDTVDSITGRALTYLLLSGTMGQLVSSSYSWLFQHSPRTNRFAGVMVFNYSPRRSLRTTSNTRPCLTMKLTW